MAASIALHAVVAPSLAAVEAQDPSAGAILNSLKVALEKAEEANPGVVHEFIDIVLESEQSKGGEESIEKLLRVANNDIADYVFEEKTPELKVLKEKSGGLKKILSVIPEQIGDRTKFLGLIREIAGKIKEVLEAISSVFTNNAKLLQKNMQQLEQHKKVFVRVSKSFSETLKRFFKDGKKDAVLRSAHRLINQTNLVLRTVKVTLES
eukprot:m.12687 g.12687  ORF g.12687 m.12687 type:complete len:208 (-) comp4711_c0_seq2:164-787(-)